MKPRIVRTSYFTDFYNLSAYPYFVMHLPEDGHKSGRNM